jgi:hypothetical protein
LVTCKNNLVDDFQRQRLLLWTGSTVRMRLLKEFDPIVARSRISTANRVFNVVHLKMWHQADTSKQEETKQMILDKLLKSFQHTYIPHNGVEQILKEHSYLFALRVSRFVSRLIQAWLFWYNILWKTWINTWK